MIFDSKSNIILCQLEEFFRDTKNVHKNIKCQASELKTSADKLNIECQGLRDEVLENEAKVKCLKATTIKHAEISLKALDDSMSAQISLADSLRTDLRDIVNIVGPRRLKKSFRRQKEEGKEKLIHQKVQQRYLCPKIGTTRDGDTGTPSRIQGVMSQKWKVLQPLQTYPGC